MTVNPDLIDTYLFELEAKLEETHVLAVDLLEFAEVGRKLDEALELVRLVRNIQKPPRCMLCEKDLEDGKPGEQYICGECLLAPNPCLSSKLGEKGRGWGPNKKVEEKKWKVKI